MNYYTRKNRKTWAVLDLLWQSLPYLALCCLVGLLVTTCGKAIDKHQQHYELSQADRTTVMSWTK